jgi:hypothetical protein
VIKVWKKAAIIIGLMVFVAVVLFTYVVVFVYPAFSSIWNEPPGPQKDRMAILAGVAAAVGGVILILQAILGRKKQG